MTSTLKNKAPLRTLVTGTVISSKKMISTIIVQVKRKVKHPLYGKFVNRFSKMYVHDAEGKASLGDMVEIQMCKPISKKKNWTLVKIINQYAKSA